MGKIFNGIAIGTLVAAVGGLSFKYGVDRTVDYYDSLASQKSESEVNDRIITLDNGTYNLGACNSRTNDVSLYQQITLEPKEYSFLGTDKQITWLGYSYHPVDSVDSIVLSEKRRQSLPDLGDVTLFDHTNYLRFHKILVNSNDGDTPRMYYLCDGEVDVSVLSDNQDQFIIRQEIIGSQ